MAIGDPYVTTPQLRAYAQVFDRADDDELTRVAAAVSRSVEHYTGRQFNDAGSTSARTYCPTLPGSIRVDDFSTTVGLVVKSDTSNDGSYATTIAASDYYVTPLDGVVAGRTGFPFNEVHLRYGGFLVNGTPSIEVTAQWGFASVPDDVVQAVLLHAAKVFGRRYSVNGIIGAGDFAFRVSSRDDHDVASLLAPYVSQVLVR